MIYFSQPQSHKNFLDYFITKFAFCAVFHILLLCCGASQAQSGKDTVDQAYLPIQPQDLKTSLMQASQDAVKLYTLVRRADHQDLPILAYTTLKKMRQDQPKNANIIAAYCFAFQVADGDYANPDRKNHPLTDADRKDYAAALTQAYRIDPKLWLTYAVEGHSMIAAPFDNVKGFNLLKKAVSLKPDISYTHILLAEAYTVYGTTYHSYAKAIQECEAAKQLKPVSAVNASRLFFIYDIRVPNREKAKEAKQYLLSTLPPDFKLDPSFQERLAKY